MASSSIRNQIWSPSGSSSAPNQQVRPLGSRLGAGDAVGREGTAGAGAAAPNPGGVRRPVQVERGHGHRLQHGARPGTAHFPVVDG